MNGDGKGWIPAVLGLGLIALVLLIGAFGTDLTRAIMIVTVGGGAGGFVNVLSGTMGSIGLGWRMGTFNAVS